MRRNETKRIDHAHTNVCAFLLVASILQLHSHTQHFTLTHSLTHTRVAISTSITRSERLEAVQKAKDSFNHDLQAVHDDEIRTGADAALTKHLTFLAFHAQSCTDEHVLEELLTEISLTCDVLESLFRASSDSVGFSFVRMGRELMQLLVGLLDNELVRRMERLKQRRQQQDNKVGKLKENPDEEQNESNDTPDLEDAGMDVDNPPPTAAATTTTTTTTTTSVDDLCVDLATSEGDLLLRKATKILGHFARVGEATQSMAHFPGLLGCLLTLISTQPYRLVPWEARLSGLWIIANLACNNENMQMMACTPGMIGTLVGIASRPLHPGDDLELTMEVLRSRAIASRAILNLSWSPENKVILAEHAPLIDLLSELTVHRKAPLNKSRTVQGILLTTRCHAVGALRNLAAAPRRIKIGLCEYKNGHLLDVLTDAALNDPDNGVKDRAFAAIHNLAIHDTAEKIVNHPALVLALKDVLLSEEEPDEHEEDSPKKHASATLLVLERSITPEMDSFENLRDLLQAVNPNPAASEGDTESEMEVLHATAV